MRFAQFDEISPAVMDTPLPWRQRQSSATLPGAFVVAALAATVLLVAIPGALIIAHLASGDDAVRLVTDHPGSAIQIALGLALASALVGWPLYLNTRRIGRRRDVTIDARQVSVSEFSPAGKTDWSEPLSAYLGIAHHLRTTQAGPRHELILVHRDPRRHVIVACAERLTRADIERAALQLGVAEVPAAALYRLPEIAIPRPSLRRQRTPDGTALETVEV
ncbi:MAG: hypothetical protein ACK4MF_03315 [Hyphomicrobiaceae bacterium]